MRASVGNGLAMLGILALWGGLSSTAPRWARFFREPLAQRVAEEAGGASSGAEPAAQPSPEAQEPQRKISVKLFFAAPDRSGLVIEDRTVAFSNELPRQIRVVVEELIKGSESNLPPFAPDARVLEVFLAARGVAYVDLSKEVLANQPGGSEAELLSVYSVVNSITTNFPAVRRVQILVDDHPATTFLGHVDLSRPLTADMSLLAPAVVSAVGAPPAAPPAAPSPAPSPVS